MRVNIGEAVQISSLKGDRNSAQGFNPISADLNGGGPKCRRRGMIKPSLTLTIDQLGTTLYNTRLFL